MSGLRIIFDSRILYIFAQFSYIRSDDGDFILTAIFEVMGIYSFPIFV